MTKLDSYSLTRAWFDFAFENPSKVKVHHTALFCWLIELNNRNGWAKEFNAPASVSMTACGIHSYNTYAGTLRDLVAFGFVIMVKPSTNQYTPNVIALSSNDEAQDKALDKAMYKATPIQSTEHSESTVQSNDSNIKPLNKEPLNKETIKPRASALSSLKISFAEQAWQNTEHSFGKEIADLWQSLNKNKKWSKKPLSAVSLALKQISKYPEAFALVLLENAIAGDYAGLVFPDTPDFFAKWQRQVQSNDGTKTIRMTNPQTGIHVLQTQTEYEEWMTKYPNTGMQFSYVKSGN